MEQIAELIQRIHSTNNKFVLVSNGPGTQCIAWLSAGKKRSLLEATVLFDEMAFADYLGGSRVQDIENFKIARFLAGRAFGRTLSLRGSNMKTSESLFGVSIYSVPDEEHTLVIFGIWSRQEVKHWEFRFKNVRSELIEEDITSKLILNLLSQQCGCGKDPIPIEIVVEEKSSITTETNDFSSIAHDLYNKRIQFFGIGADGVTIFGDKDSIPRSLSNNMLNVLESSENLSLSSSSSNEILKSRMILPGSFNPFHYGHWELLESAMLFAKHNNITYQSYDYEISAFNVDKPPIEVETMYDRVNQFSGIGSVLITNAPTFVQKSNLFPNSTFVVGYDTAIRIINKKYYNDSEDGVIAAIKEIQANGCDFIVGGRLINGKFVSPSELAIVDQFKGTFKFLEEFRVDISSTEIRESGKRRWRRSFWV